MGYNYYNPSDDEVLELDPWHQEHIRDTANVWKIKQEEENEFPTKAQTKAQRRHPPALHMRMVQ